MSKSHLKYFNPNPLYKEPKAGKKPKVWRIGDCAVRAVCAATGMSWETAYLTMSESAMKAYAPFNTLEGFEQVMVDLGFKKVSSIINIIKSLKQRAFIFASDIGE